MKISMETAKSSAGGGDGVDFVQGIDEVEVEDNRGYKRSLTGVGLSTLGPVEEPTANNADSESGGETGDNTSSGGSGGRNTKKPRLIWTAELHSRFMNAVNHLGVKNAVPKTILQLMNVEGMTRENVASHLQKYRLYLKRLAGLPPNARLPPDVIINSGSVHPYTTQLAMTPGMALPLPGPSTQVLAAMGQPCGGQRNDVSGMATTHALGLPLPDPNAGYSGGPFTLGQAGGGYPQHSMYGYGGHMHSSSLGHPWANGRDFSAALSAGFLSCSGPGPPMPPNPDYLSANSSYAYQPDPSLGGAATGIPNMLHFTQGHMVDQLSGVTSESVSGGWHEAWTRQRWSESGPEGVSRSW